MARSLTIAAIQMDATPAPLAQRLARAETLIASAVDVGAQIVVLPELFNIGYAYDDANYARAEPADGPTATWLATQARQRGVYVAGSLLLRDHEDIYNAALLVSPHGRSWRYDKMHPFLWEWAYFREGRAITVAETELGKLGLMICWDSAHPDVWARYAGKVDAVLIPSCPPTFQRGRLRLPDGTLAHTVVVGHHFADGDIHALARWAGVPAVHSGGSGHFCSPSPSPFVTAAAYLAARPHWWPKLAQAPQAQLEADYERHTQIIGPDGRVLARCADEGDGFIVAQVPLADEPPIPSGPPPAPQTQSWVYLMADALGPTLLARVYRRGARWHWGARMAPLDATSRRWRWLALGALVAGFLLAALSRRR